MGKNLRSRWLTRKRLGLAGTLASVAWAALAEDFHPVGTAVTTILLIVGVLSGLSCLGVLVWDMPAVVWIRVRSAYPHAVAPTKAALNVHQAVDVGWDVSFFQAAAAPYPRRGKILGIRCTNTSQSEGVRDIRVRLDDLVSVDTGDPAQGFTPGFLTWESGTTVRDLPPRTHSVAAFVRNDQEYAMFVQPLPQTTALPWSLADGRWRASFTITAWQFQPSQVSIAFRSRRPPVSQSDMGALEFI